MTTLYPPHLPIGVYRVTLVALEPVELSTFSAATLRGAFGWSFKRMVCYQPQVKTCRGCLLRGQCPYPQVFEPPPPPDSIYTGQQQTVAPYVLRRPLDATSASAGTANKPQSYAPGESFAFEIVLAGWANGMIPYFALALQQLEAQGIGRGRGRVAVAAIDLLPPRGSGTVDSGQVSLSPQAGKVASRSPGEGCFASMMPISPTRSRITVAFPPGRGSARRRRLNRSPSTLSARRGCNQRDGCRASRTFMSSTGPSCGG
ncbi:MAG: hypothetical protein R2932_03770 [Caldilineaceae bacterium]